MKVMVVEARYEGEIELPLFVVKQLPPTVTLAVPVQYLGILPSLVKQLATHRITARLFQGFHTRYPGQILGCDIVTATQGSDAFLYVGDGLFHPKTLVLKSDKPVHCYFPYTGEYKLLTHKDVEDIVRRHALARALFRGAKRIGILVTTKYGQSNLKAAFAIKQHLAGKDVTIFLADTLDWSDLENYPFVELWINTMCPRISYDDQPKFRKLVLDLSDAVELLKEGGFSFSGLLAARARE
ncbi:diphthamide synthesis protein [Candidatus Woesearchaeota archaeon]|nr:diphthamide synthesis protein [Candidatus Woesearchaeota archaeon]